MGEEAVPKKIGESRSLAETVTRTRREVPPSVSPWPIFVSLAILVALLWYCWATVGAPWMARKLSAELHADAMARAAEVAASAPAPTTLQDLGQTGDIFGGVNALFAALAFIGVGVAAYYQRESWRLQHASWQMLVDAEERAERDHVRQSFEPLFFELLKRVRSPNPLAATDSRRIPARACWQASAVQQGAKSHIFGGWIRKDKGRS